jgi:DNA polymerase/3'-5' exonuclease PolX
MVYHDISKIAEKYKSLLDPHCIRIEIAGSVRRMKIDCRDIEYVIIPKPYDVGLFESGIAMIINQWQMVKGNLPSCKYTQRILPEGIKADIFFATEENFGLIYLIRTGSADFSRRIATRWADRGYHAFEGALYYTGNRVTRRDEIKKGKKIYTPTEIDVFNICGLPYIEPWARI